MTPGLLVLLLVLAIAECVALLLRRRFVTRLRWAAEEQECELWLSQLRRFGMAASDATAAASTLAETMRGLAS